MHTQHAPEPVVDTPAPVPSPAVEPIFDVRDVAVFYGPHKAVADITLALRRNEITALIGPSGCGKSTFIRCLNRMNDLIASARVQGQVVYHEHDLYDAKDRKSTRLNSSHANISYAVFCLKKKTPATPLYMLSFYSSHTHL